MKQPDSLDVGTKMDVVRHRLNVAREDLDTAHLTFEAGQYRAANNRAYYSIFHTSVRCLLKRVLLLSDIRIRSATLTKIMYSRRFFLVNWEGKL